VQSPPYKGLDLLAEAFLMLVQADRDYRLVIAGLPKGGCEGYLREVREALREEIEAGTVLERIGYVSDEETEVYLKAADVLVLPYRAIFQSGILMMAASFGLPVVASDVGSFRPDILALKSGLVCRPNDSGDLAAPLKNTSAEICIVTFSSTEVGFAKWPVRIIHGVASQLRQSLLIFVSSRGPDEPSTEHMTRSAAKVAVGGGKRETVEYG